MANNVLNNNRPFPGETLSTGAPRRCPDCTVEAELQVLRVNRKFFVGSVCFCGIYTIETLGLNDQHSAQTVLDYLELHLPTSE